MNTPGLLELPSNAHIIASNNNYIRCFELNKAVSNGTLISPNKIIQSKKKKNQLNLSFF